MSESGTLEVKHSDAIVLDSSYVFAGVRANQNQESFEELVNFGLPVIVLCFPGEEGVRATIQHDDSCKADKVCGVGRNFGYGIGREINPTGNWIGSECWIVCQIFLTI